MKQGRHAPRQCPVCCKTEEEGTCVCRLVSDLSPMGNLFSSCLVHFRSACLPQRAKYCSERAERCQSNHCCCNRTWGEQASASSLLLLQPEEAKYCSNKKRIRRNTSLSAGVASSHLQSLSSKAVIWYHDIKNST
mmetsp:Transcript_35027/g.104455  ORF Transcript_35027/g.104455 Transcript_35027/m.104455 type:complete len:135 (+) Transcript_35027:1190-1594(+)